MFRRENLIKIKAMNEYIFNRTEPWPRLRLSTPLPKYYVRLDYLVNDSIRHGQIIQRISQEIALG